jgi:ArsR family transcriptional regulator, arsenate/arsenite/antimonite-responsive transcriptional repressor
MQLLISFLVDDCCDGHPELCNLLGATGAGRGCGRMPKKAKLKSQSKLKAR